MTITELRNEIINTLNNQKISIDSDERDEYFNYGIDTCISYIEDIFENLEVAEHESK